MSTTQARLQQFTDIRILSLLVALVLLGDLATTAYGLSIGLPEQNPFVKTVIEAYGVVGMVGLKALVVLWVGAIYKTLGARYGKAALLGLFRPNGIAVVLNLITIA